MCVIFFETPILAVDWVEVTKDGKGFVLSPSGQTFNPWGFNYDRDYNFRLIEDYWNTEWSTIEQDFIEMKNLGANVVRVHLQFAKFMDSADKVNQISLERLQQLVDLAEKTGMYLNLTGLGCYRKQDIPSWYDALTEKDRWASQAHFWEAIAQSCADKPAVWCYDLMNEPVVSGDKRKDWLHTEALENLYYVQFINLNPAKRERTDIARQWTQLMVNSIRKYDRRHLITIGLFMIEYGLPENSSGFGPMQIGSELDFIRLHLYPEANNIDQWVNVLMRSAQAGKPVIIEEIFPLKCDVKTLENFIERTSGIASGLIGFYWGKTPTELKQSEKMTDQVTLQWIKLFQQMNPNR
jgi:endo-1,4-beta-mannosidase